VRARSTSGAEIIAEGDICGGTARVSDVRGHVSPYGLCEMRFASEAAPKATQLPYSKITLPGQATCT
jgi:hypothetical protein